MFSWSVMSDSLRLQHVRLPCPSPAPRAYSNSCPWSWWCHPTISSSVTSFSCPQTFAASGSLPKALQIRWPKYWSFSFSICPANEYSGLVSFRIDWFDLLIIPGTRKNLIQYHSSKASILQCSVFLSMKRKFFFKSIIAVIVESEFKVKLTGCFIRLSLSCYSL